MTQVVVTPSFDVRLGPDWAREALIDDVRRGFTRRPLRIPPRWLYDDRGSELFDRITRLREYYPTEAERSILLREADRIAELTGADTLIELGSGTSDKTHALLTAFHRAGQLQRFVPVDVSEQTLRDAAQRISQEYPGVHVHGVVGDFALDLAQVPVDGRPMVAFLGSTLGNLYVEERQAFLAMLADLLPDDGWLLLGIDLVKPVERLVAAYDDPLGVTAEFTRNVLHRLNRELSADFDVEAFEHVALWDPVYSRMDLRLRAGGDHHVTIPGAAVEIDLHDGEEILIEISSKFTVPGISGELRDAGFTVRQLWTDAHGDMALVLAAVGSRD